MPEHFSESSRLKDAKEEFRKNNFMWKSRDKVALNTEIAKTIALEKIAHYLGSLSHDGESIVDTLSEIARQGRLS